MEDRKQHSRSEREDEGLYRRAAGGGVSSSREEDRLDEIEQVGGFAPASGGCRHLNTRKQNLVQLTPATIRDSKCLNSDHKL